VLCGIDNHFQLLLYINENHCQLETKTFLRKFLRNANKARYHAISKYKKLKIILALQLLMKLEY
uniref:hypothetical protein n=1 Tax=Staphylococcus argenteus TaxID=985002 RepID=UPI00345052AC